MKMHRSAEFDTAKAELAARIAALDVRAPYVETCELAPDIDAIRVLAQRNRLDPAATVAHYLNTALARGEGVDRTALVHGWLSMLTEAVASERQDAAACDAFAAACAGRLAS
jgi:phosphoglucomutase